MVTITSVHHSTLPYSLPAFKCNLSLGCEPYRIKAILNIPSVKRFACSGKKEKLRLKRLRLPWFNGAISLERHFFAKYLQKRSVKLIFFRCFVILTYDFRFRINPMWQITDSLKVCVNIQKNCNCAGWHVNKVVKIQIVSRRNAWEQSTRKLRFIFFLLFSCFFKESNNVKLQ